MRPRTAADTGESGADMSERGTSRHRARPGSRSATAAGLVLAVAGGLAAALGGGGTPASAALSPGALSPAARPAPAATSTATSLPTASPTVTGSGTPTVTRTVADCFPGCVARTFDFEDGTAQGWTDSEGRALPVTDAVAASGKRSAGPGFVLSSRGPSVTITSAALASPMGYWYTASVKVLGESTREVPVRLVVEGARETRDEQVLLSATEWRTVRTWFKPTGGSGTITLRLTEGYAPCRDVSTNIQTAFVDDGVVGVPLEQAPPPPPMPSPTGCATTTPPPTTTPPTTTPPAVCLPGRCVVHQESFMASTIPAGWSHTGTGALSLRREGGAMTLNSLQATQVSTIGGPSLLLDDPRLRNPSGKWFQVKLRVRVDGKQSKPRVRLQVDGTDLVQTSEIVVGPKFKVIQAWFKPSGPVRITVVAAPSTCVKPQHVIPALMVDDVSVAMPGQGKAPKGEPTTPPATCW